jgi:hypothetical protein
MSLGCNSIKGISIPSKYETVYSRTINKDQFESIYQILEDNFSDFPVKKNKINYKRINDKYSLNIILKKKNFKLVYRSNTGYNNKINSIKSKIELIK